MSAYSMRAATIDDIDALVRHRLAMFTDMGTTIDHAAVASAFRTWVNEMMTSGSYRAWVIATTDAEIVGGGGITILPWPPGPFYVGGRVAFVYNVYVEPAHRRRGLARRMMDTIHDWCRQNGIGLVGLQASEHGRALYTALGYRPAPNPLMFAAVDAESARAPAETSPQNS